VPNVLNEQHSWPRVDRTTLKDVALEVGVSESTVSVVINGARSGTRVSADTRRAVLEAASRLGYHSNSNAKSLLTGVTNRFGLYTISPNLDTSNFFLSELLRGFFEGCGELNYNSLIHTAGTTQQKLLELVANRAVDGLIVHALPGDPILPILSELKVPAISIADHAQGLPAVVVDEELGGKLLAQHLFERGHRNVLVKDCPDLLDSVVRRVQAFCERAHELGMSIEIGSHTHWDDRALISSSDFEAISRSKDRVTAMFLWEDSVASKVLAELINVGFRIPHDIAMVGFNGLRSPSPQTQLTTIDANWNLVGKTGVRLLSKLLAGESIPAETVVPVKFLRGATT
jgi:LacI family transcriptional regulator